MDLNTVQGSRRSMGLAAVVVVAGLSLALLGVISALDDGAPSATEAAVASMGGGAPSPLATASATPSRSPRPRLTPRPTTPPTPAPTHLPWEFAPIRLTGLEGFSAGVTAIWALPDRFVIAVDVDAPIAEMRSQFLTSPDGQTWTIGTSPRPGFAARAGTVVDGRLFVFGGVSDDYGARWSLWSTTDAVTWTRVVGPEGLGDGVADVRDIEGGPGGWVAVVSVFRADVNCHVACVGDELRYSADGVHWRAAAVPDLGTFARFAGIASSDSTWVAVSTDDGDAGGATILARSSTGGATWSPVRAIASLDGTATGVAAFGDRFAIVGEEVDEVLHPRSWSSADGVTWTYTGMDAPVNRELRGMGSVVPTSDGFLALSASDTGDAWRWTARDGWRDFAILPPGDGDHLIGLALLGDTVLVGGFSNEDLTRIWIGSLQALTDEP